MEGRKGKKKKQRKEGENSTRKREDIMKIGNKVIKHDGKEERGRKRSRGRNVRIARERKKTS